MLFLFPENTEEYVEIEYIYLSDEDYINEDLSQYDADIVILQENYNRMHPFKLMDLMTHCKFKDWYWHVEEFKAFYNGNILPDSNNHSMEAMHLKDDAFKEFSRLLLDTQLKEHRIGYLYNLYRFVTLPAGFKSVHSSGDSIIDYSKIIRGF